MIDAPTNSARRKEIQRRFNADPARDPLRILLATDAALYPDTMNQRFGAWAQLLVLFRMIHAR